MATNRRSRPPKEPATSTTTTLFPESNAPGAAEVELLRGIVDKTERGIWQDLMNGRFKLALRCEVCGRWLTAHASKSAGVGPRCAARAVK